MQSLNGRCKELNGEAEQQIDNIEDSMEGNPQLALFSPFVRNCISTDTCKDSTQSWYRLAGIEKQNIEDDLLRKSVIE